MKTVHSDTKLEIGDLLMVVKDNVHMPGIGDKGQVVHVSAVYKQKKWDGQREIIKINANKHAWTIENFAFNFALLEYHEKQLYEVLFE